MTEALEQQPEATVEIGSAADPINPAPASANDLGALLAQFDAGTNAHTSDNGSGSGDHDQAANAPDPQFQEGELDKLLSDLNRDTERTNALQSEVNALKAAEAQRLERAEFEDFANNLQKRLPEWSEPDRAMRELSFYAHREDVRCAWETRGVSAAERRAAPAQLAQLQALYQQMRANPSDDPRQQAAMAAVVRRGQWLEKVVLGHPNVLRRMEDEIHKRAWEPRIDPDATAMRMEVAAAVRGSSGKVTPAGPPNYGTLSNNDFRKLVRDEHGFDPIT
jgi:hypothetical protein